MSRGEPNLKHLTPISEERQRVMDAVEEAYWQGNTEQGAALDLELDYINVCVANGDLYAPLF